MAKPKGDLSVTALYTSGVWHWGGLPGAELLATPEAGLVFRLTNAALWLARLLRPELPSLRHSLLQRHLMIDRLVAEAQPGQVIELASGFSARGLALSANPALRYTELDLPAVIRRKRELLARTEQGRAAGARQNLGLVEADVLTASLAPLVQPPGPLFVIAEGLFMYLSAEEQRRLWSKLRGLFDLVAGTLVFDLVPAGEQPPPGRVGRLLAAWMKRFTGGRAFERDARSRDDLVAELHQAGFSRVDLLEPRTVATAWSLPFPGVRTQQLLFVCRP